MKDKLYGVRVYVDITGACFDGRELAEVYKNGENIGLESVRMGFAEVYPTSSKKFQEYIDAMTEAWQAKRGIWANENTEKSGDVYITLTGNKYHKEGSQYLRKGGFKIDRTLAGILGYGPSKDFV